MKMLDTLKICGPHICQSNKISIKEGKAIIIILDGEAMSHIRRNHIDKAEITVICAGTDAVEDGSLKFHTKILIIVFVEFDELLLSISVLDKKLNLLVSHCKAEVNDIAQRHVID